MIALRFHRNERTGKCNPSIATIRETSGVRNVPRALNKLEEKGRLQRDRPTDGRSSNSFVVHDYCPEDRASHALLDVAVSCIFPDGGSTELIPDRAERQRRIRDWKQTNSKGARKLVELGVTSEWLHNNLKHALAGAEEEKRLAVRMDQIVRWYRANMPGVVDRNGDDDMPDFKDADVSS